MYQCTLYNRHMALKKYIELTLNDVLYLGYVYSKLNLIRHTLNFSSLLALLDMK